eukprot:NODE_3045_length_989_cov_5.118085_g2543_i0.p2 GENE.NODE_3045_length_989_cov_5.118085_g2543_i0~~NODE_3045_length_989_cov_5.118085_g2543_i0.p2  ORF type:complete len:201 (-),score=45.09 NODE_3045_length_989_cov_5.118085_g2543_i0:90-692(-)
MEQFVVEHGYCSQALVNLLLTGKATPHVFDEDKTIDDSLTLSGIQQRSDIGFLTLTEYYNPHAINVGESLKIPRAPIWVVCSESHYSVLFQKQDDYDKAPGTQNKEPSTAPFDLMYYDPLGNQAEDIRLSVTPAQKRPKAPKKPKEPEEESSCYIPPSDDEKSASEEEEDDDMIPPLVKVIRTCWGPATTVDWNGTEPLL